MGKKRGAIEIQFNWVFIFIAGSLILAVFVGFVNKQSENAELKLGAQIVGNTNSIITQSYVTSDKSSVVTLVKPLEFRCVDSCNSFGCDSGFNIQDTTVGWSTPVQVIFAPDLIDGREMVTWSKDWSVPFRVMNFLYLTSKDVRYVFIDTSSTSDDKIVDFYDEMPKSLKAEKVPDPSTLKNLNNYKVKLIYYDISTTPQLPNGLKSMPVGDVSAVVIESSASKIEFYKTLNTGFSLEGDAYYLGDAPIYGAIFSENMEMYNCNMKKALLRLGKVSDLYLDRVQDLQPEYSACSSIYGNAINSLMEIKNFGDPDKLGSLNGMQQYISEVEDQNQALMVHSCPVIY
ncbi:hypothetical protein KY320_02185 [Candidatus Woesearchaeota archaeon]|nr:hypothetical protein [Candidatus Woesearchaeota archaeon]